jgi:hypothetical protein
VENNQRIRETFPTSPAAADARAFTAQFVQRTLVHIRENVINPAAWLIGAKTAAGPAYMFRPMASGRIPTVNTHMLLDSQGQLPQVVGAARLSGRF